MSRILKQIPAYLLWMVWTVMAVGAFYVLFVHASDYGTGSLFGDLITHWPLAVLFVVVGLMLAGHFGPGLGLPTLFRDDPDGTEWFWRSRSFGGGFGVNLLLSVVWTVIGFCNFIESQERIVRLKEHSSRDARSEWNVTKLQDQADQLVRDFEEDWPAMEVQLSKEVKLRALPMDRTEITIRLDGFYENAEDIEEALRKLNSSDQRREEVIKKTHHLRDKILDYTIHVHLTRMADTLVLGPFVFFLFFVGCFGITTRELAKRRLSSKKRFVAFQEFCRFLGGNYACYIINVVIYMLIFLADKMFWSSFGQRSAHGQSTNGSIIGFTRFQNWMDASAVLVFIAGTIFVLLLVLWLPRVFTRLPRVSAGLGICILFSGLALFYLFLVAIQPRSQVLFVGGVAVGLIWINSSPYKYRFPGMEAYYKSPCNLQTEDKEIEQFGARHRPGPLDDSGEHELLDDREVLNAWAGQFSKAQGGRKPKLVLVTTTGAAYRASFWTTTVLEKLASEPGLPGFLNHVRLITGASGGMVGAAYVVAMLEQPKPGHGYSPTVDATEQLRTRLMRSWP